MAGPGRARSFFERHTVDLAPGDLRRLFTRETPEAYRFFARGLDVDALAARPWYRRWPAHARLLLSAFAMRLSPARRILYAFALASAALGLVVLFDGIGPTRLFLFPFAITLPLPQWVDGTLWLVLSLLAINLLILMEVADRLSLKNELEIARDIQLAMLPAGLRQAGDAEVAGVTRPANTVGGDFYDIVRQDDGRVVLALGDVAGKGSPAALLMALVVAMLRTLAEERLDPASLVARLNLQVARHSPPSRFITLFYGVYDPATGRLEYVNAGHLPPLVCRRDGRFERLDTAGNGLALGLFPQAAYVSHALTVEPGDVFVAFSDGLTEAESPGGRPFEDTGLESVIARERAGDPEALGRALLGAVEAHVGDARLADDLTALVLKRGS